MEYQKATNKGSNDRNKGQGSSLLLCHHYKATHANLKANLWLFICQALQIVFDQRQFEVPGK